MHANIQYNTEDHWLFKIGSGEWGLSKPKIHLGLIQARILPKRRKRFFPLTVWHKKIVWLIGRANEKSLTSLYAYSLKFCDQDFSIDNLQWHIPTLAVTCLRKNKSKNYCSCLIRSQVSNPGWVALLLLSFMVIPRRLWSKKRQTVVKKGTGKPRYSISRSTRWVSFSIEKKRSAVVDADINEHAKIWRNSHS